MLIRQARGGRGAPDPAPADQRYAMPLTPSEWQEIQRLAADADMDALPDVVGCPDCADGGAESLSIETTSGAEGVSLEFRAALPEAQPLLDRVRALRSQLMPEDHD